MAVATATLGRDVIGNISHFDCEFPESYSGDPTNQTRNYESRHNTLFGRGMPKTTQVLSLSRIFRDAHCRGGASIYRATIF